MRGIGLFLGTQYPQRGIPLISIPSPRAIVDETITAFDGTFVLTNATLAQNAVPNYDGSGTADYTRETADTGTHHMSKSMPSITLGVQYAADLVVKADGRNHLLFQVSGSGNNANVIFDLTDNGAGTPTGLDSWSVTDLSNGWKHLRMIFTAVATGIHGVTLYHATSKTVFTGIVGDITKGLIFDRYTLSHNP